MRRLFLSALSVPLLLACQSQNATHPVQQPAVSASPAPSGMPSSAALQPLVSPSVSLPSPTTTASPTSLASPTPDEALTRSYQTLERSWTYAPHLEPGQRQYFRLNTEPGKHYTLTTDSNKLLQQLYFGSQATVPLGPAGRPNDLDLDFFAEYPAYYLILTSPTRLDYQLKFDDWAPKPTPSPMYFFTEPCCEEYTTLNGRVYDDTHALLDGVTVRARSLNSFMPFDSTTTTSGGSYAFNKTPSGVQIEISATHSGYAFRRRMEVLKSNKTGDPNANRYDFGNDGESAVYGLAYNALSDKPEVTTVTPGRNGSGINYGTSFKLTFSEPMDRTTVENNFEIYTFNTKKLTVDTRAAGSTVAGPGDVNQLTGTRVWDKAAFNVSWNYDDMEATFVFKDNLALPTDRDSARTPDYQVGLNRQDGVIKDKSGISRGVSEKKFKLSDGDFERSYKFSIKVDEKKPMLTDISLLNPAGLTGLSLNYSEAMQISTLGGTFAGGLGGMLTAAPAALPGFVTAAEAAGNYLLTLRRKGQTIYDKVSWASLGGEAVIDPGNPRRVLLSNPALVFQSGDEVEIEAATTILDPAGNPLDVSGSQLRLVVGAF